MTLRRWAAVLVGLGIGTLLAVLGAPPASAHATLSSSDPADGARLTRAPSQVSVTFDESVGLGVGYLKVINSTGRQVDLGGASHPGGWGAVVAVRLPAGLGDDTYLVSWLVVSADSHPVQGSVRFVVGRGELRNVAAPSVTTTGGAVATVLDATRWVGFAGVGLLGGAWLVLTVWRDGGWLRRTRLLIGTGWGLTTLATASELLLQGPYTSARRLTATFNADLLRVTLQSDFGQLHALRLILLGLLGWMLVVGLARTAVIDGATMAALTALVGLAILLTYPASGHARASSPVALAVTSDLAHLAAMAAWVGGLAVLVLVLLPLGRPDELREVLPVFSRVAFVSVAVLAVTGTYQAWRESGTIDALTSTTYGYLVLAKVALFAGLILLGNLSRRAVQRRLGPTLGNDVGAVAGRMRRVVAMEVVLALGVLGLTGVLVAEPPGRAAAATTARHVGPRSGRADLGAGRSIRLTVDPARSGPVAVTAILTGAPVQELTIGAALPERRFGPLPVRVRRQPDGTYRADNVLLPSPGNWVFTVTARFSEFDAISATLNVRVS
ncbi:MAG: copper resistance protein CopC [Actinomycetota bacterium]|nr:copper resistance protein CopC [Actinomycetota bacterium]